MPHDIFVSYAHVDDAPVGGAGRGMVTQFVEELKRELPKGMSGRRPTVWMDRQLAANERVTETLDAHLQDSRTILLFLSSAYLGSKWCKFEVENFLARNEARFNKENVFVVALKETDRERWPARLRALSPIQLFEKDPSSGITRTLGWPIQPIHAPGDLYWQRLNELATLIARHLEQGTDGPAPAQPGPLEDPGAFDLAALEQAWRRPGRLALDALDFVDASDTPIREARVKDDYRLRVRVRAQPWLTLVERGTSGRWILAFPTLHSPRFLLQPQAAYHFPGELLRLPLPTARIRRLSFGDRGIETVLAIATPQPLAAHVDDTPSGSIFPVLTDAAVRAMLEEASAMPGAELSVCRVVVS